MVSKPGAVELSAVVMCGGSGTRFWPASRRRSPKQFLRLLGKTSLIQDTVARLEGLVPPERIYLLAGEEHSDLLRRHLPQVSSDNYILEPAPRNTGPALALAARVLEARSPSAVIAALPADHSISNAEGFRRALGLAAAAAAERGAIATLGITPDVPETGYGYIEIGDELSGGLRAVERFVEKPSQQKAEEYLRGGRHLWNSGMFAMPLDALVRELKRQQPRIWRPLWQEMDGPDSPDFAAELERLYPTLPKISIDYAVMEGAEQVLCIPSEFGWNDLGSWSALEKLWGADGAGNAADSRYYAVDSHGNIVSGGRSEIALVGVENMVVVERDGVVLVCAKERCQELRELIALLEHEGRDDLL